ncbi:hypothetical protein [Siculibacillus lacustris]|nr:hypothetical protein [Siculibacillus lacustris]
MADGHSRKGREDRKPKAEKPKAVPAAAANANLAMIAAINNGPKKKK